MWVGQRARWVVVVVACRRDSCLRRVVWALGAVLLLLPSSRLWVWVL